MADSGSTKNLTYSKPKQFDGEGTIQLDADSIAPRETGGTPRFKDKMRMTKGAADDIFEWPASSDDEKPKKTSKRKKTKSPPPKQRKEGPIQQKQKKI